MLRLIEFGTVWQLVLWASPSEKAELQGHDYVSCLQTAFAKRETAYIDPRSEVPRLCLLASQIRDRQKKLS